MYRDSSRAEVVDFTIQYFGTRAGPTRPDGPARHTPISAELTRIDPTQAVARSSAVAAAEHLKYQLKAGTHFTV